MRLFLFSLMFASMSVLSAQNCKKIVISTQKQYHDFSFQDLSSSMISSTLSKSKRQYIESLIKPIYQKETESDLIIYLKDTKGVLTAKAKSSDSENVFNIEKIERFKKDLLFLHFDNQSVLLINLDNKSAFDLKNGQKYDVNVSPCEF